MKPFRLFVILVLLTASALAIVYVRVANVRTAYRVQKLHARCRELIGHVARQQAAEAKLSDPARIRDQLPRQGDEPAERLLPAPAQPPRPVRR